MDKIHVWQLKLLVQRGEVAGVGQGVEHTDVGILAVYINNIFHKVGADESGATGNKVFHIAKLVKNRDSNIKTGVKSVILGNYAMPCRGCQANIRLSLYKKRLLIY